jgi:hypothetical protein
MIKRIPRYYPGWWSTGGGGGLSSVTTDATLAGAGTSGNPLKLPPVNYFCWNNRNANGYGPGAGNQIAVAGFILLVPITTSNITVNVSTADAVNNCDIGIYNFAGSLRLNIGAQTLPSTGDRTFAWSQGSTTLLPGLYAVAFTSTAATAKLGYDSGAFLWLASNNYAASAGGALPASVTAFSLVPATDHQNINWFVLT